MIAQPRPVTWHRRQPLHAFMSCLMIGVFGSAVAEDKASDALIAYPGYTGEYPGFTLVLDDRFDSFDTDVWRKGDGHRLIVVTLRANQQLSARPGPG